MGSILLFSASGRLLRESILVAAEGRSKKAEVQAWAMVFWIPAFAGMTGCKGWQPQAKLGDGWCVGSQPSISWLLRILLPDREFFHFDWGSRGGNGALNLGRQGLGL
jgi:hypothetical protein